MLRQNTFLALLLANIPAVAAFAPQFSVLSGAAPGATSGVDIVSKSVLSSADSILISVAQEGESVARQGVINWDNPVDAIIGSVFLLYVTFSILAGLKYVVKDGYRPKF